MPPAPIEHDAQGLSRAAAVALIADVRASVERATTAALDDLEASVGAPIATVALRTWPADFPDDIDVLRRAPYDARADAVMYRQVLADVAQARGWAVHLYDAKALGDAAARLDRHRASLGPPWTKDHRVALAAALEAAG